MTNGKVFWAIAIPFLASPVIVVCILAFVDWLKRR